MFVIRSILVFIKTYISLSLGNLLVNTDSQSWALVSLFYDNFLQRENFFAGDWHPRLLFDFSFFRFGWFRFHEGIITQPVIILSKMSYKYLDKLLAAA